MRSKKILMTTIAVVLGGFTSMSVADPAFVNLDYATHASAACTDLTGAGELNATAGSTTGNILTIGTGSGQGGCVPTVGTAPATSTTGPIFDTTIFPTATISIADSDENDGRPFAVEIVQSGNITLPSGEDGAGDPTPEYFGIVYTIDGWIDNDFRVEFTLNGANFGDALFSISNTDVALGSSDPIAQWEIFNSGVISSQNTGSDDSVAYLVQPGGLQTGEYTDVDSDSVPKLRSGSIMLLLYQMDNATALQTAGGEVTMEVEFTSATTDPNKVVAANRNFTGDDALVVATSNNSLDAKMYEEDSGTIYISVNDESKLFTDKDGNLSTSPGVDDAFRSTTIARIGYIELGSDVTTFQPDGVNKFTVGSDLGSAQDATQLVITGGQFDASAANPGIVRLVTITGGTESVITSVLSTDNTATFDLTNEQLVAMSDADKVAIDFVVDTTTEVNLVETPPTATFNLVFDDENIVVDADLATSLADVPLRQIYQDGVVCWAFNVPYATIQDRFNIRITNESAVPGSMTVTLYEPSGSEVTTAELVNVQDENGNDVLPTLKSAADLGTGTDTTKNLLPAGHTLHLNSEKLEAALGTSWNNRAVLRIVSELPEMEMLALLRNQLMDDASQPLNNLSLGAHGISCTQGQ